MSGEVGQGSRLGSLYVLDRKIGSGGMGTVWSAYHTETREAVAVKILSENLAQDPDLVGRFLRERSALLAAAHPNLVRVHDLVVENQRIALVMDLVVGVDAARLLDAAGPLPVAQVAKLGAEVAGALQAVHGAGIVHRDLKPANILVESATSMAKLVDFGIAWIAGNPRLTAVDSVVGTPHYLAPELLTGGAVTPAADVYSLAICLYQLLSGVVPFDGEHYAQILTKHLNEAPQPHPAIPPTLWSLLEAMLAKDPSYRPDMQVVAQQLAGFAHGAGPIAAIAAFPAPPVPGTPTPGTLVPHSPGTPVPGVPGTPVPGAYGTPPPGQPTPVQGLGHYSESGMFQFAAPGYVDESQGQGSPDPWGPGASQSVYSTNPPPFSYTPQPPRRDNRKILIIAAVLLLVVTGGVLAFVLGSGGGKPTPVAQAGTTSAAPTTQAAFTAHHWTLCCGDLQDTSGGTTTTSSGVVIKSSKEGDSFFNGKAGTQILVGGPVIDTQQSFTFAFWLNMHGTTSTPGGRETIVEQRGTNGCAACVEYDPNSRRFAFEMQSADSPSATTTEVQALQAPKPTDWYRIIVSYNAQTQTMAMYVGGAAQGTAKFAATWTPTGPLSLGSGLVKADTTNWYSGNLADLWIWNRALTPAQVNNAAT